MLSHFPQVVFTVEINHINAVFSQGRGGLSVPQDWLILYSMPGIILKAKQFHNTKCFMLQVKSQDNEYCYQDEVFYNKNCSVMW